MGVQVINTIVTSSLLTFDGNYAGKEVEIDESKFGKRKYNRGRVRDGQWVFGMIERGSNEVMMTVVADRTASTLIPIIQAHVRQGTTIFSDEWSAYSRIGTVCVIITQLFNLFSHRRLNPRLHSPDCEPFTEFCRPNIW